MMSSQRDRKLLGCRAASGVELLCVTAPRSPLLAAMDNACESPPDKGGETGASDETAAAPGSSGATDTDGIPEETDGDGDGDLKEAAAEEGEVGSDVLIKSGEYPEIVLLAARPASWLTPPWLR